MAGGNRALARSENRTGLVFGAHWGFVAFFVGIAGYHVVTIVLTAARGGRAGVDPAELLDSGPALLLALLLALLPSMVLGVGPMVASRRWGRGPRKDFRWLPDLRDVKVGLACGVLALGAGYVLNLVLLGWYGADRVSDSPLAGLAEGVAGNSTVWLVPAAIVVVVAVPLAEELLTRGALWGALEHHRVPGWVIVVLTAVVFGYLHGEPTRTVALTGQGIALGLARLRTGRLGAGLVAHAANNLPPALLLFVAS